MYMCEKVIKFIAGFMLVVFPLSISIGDASIFWTGIAEENRGSPEVQDKVHGFLENNTPIGKLVREIRDSIVDFYGLEELSQKTDRELHFIAAIAAENYYNRSVVDKAKKINDRIEKRKREIKERYFKYMESEEDSFKIVEGVKKRKKYDDLDYDSDSDSSDSDSDSSSDSDADSEPQNSEDEYDAKKKKRKKLKCLSKKLLWFAIPGALLVLLPVGAGLGFLVYLSLKKLIREYLWSNAEEKVDKITWEGINPYLNSEIDSRKSLWEERWRLNKFAAGVTNGGGRSSKENQKIINQAIQKAFKEISPEMTESKAKKWFSNKIDEALPSYFQKTSEKQFLSGYEPKTYFVTIKELAHENNVCNDVYYDNKLVIDNGDGFVSIGHLLFSKKHA